MIASRPRWARPLALVLAAVVFAACASPLGPTAGGRDILWRIVSHCLDRSDPGYCSTCPSPVARMCGAERGCLRTTEVWAESAEFVAIRDIKMCGCPDGFVHGLALPRARVTGIEDPRRPAGIWPFAWATARAHIPDETAIALVVNPPGAQRTQDQLHVHLVRLAPDARARLAASLAPAHSLDQVWEVAARRAAAAGLSSYGVLVSRDAAADGFLVHVQGGSPEYEFTAPVCR